MGNEAPETSLIPKIFRFTDIDQFRSSVKNLLVDFTPLVTTISAEQTILNLEGCAINLTRSFPRIIDAQLAPNCTAIGLTMDEGAAIRFNGVERDRSAIVIGSNGAAYSSVEYVERQYASIIFTPAVENRGWPPSHSNFRLFETDTATRGRLQQLVRQVLATASKFTGLTDATLASTAIRESLLAAADAAFASLIPSKWTAYANSTRQFGIFQDIRAVLAGNLQGPIYSEALAAQLGISVRTMHDAVLRYRGMSLHRYLRLRRLWLVRQRLLAGADSVKSAALAFGFWHLGDFSGNYRQQFGESPSETLARSRRG